MNFQNCNLLPYILNNCPFSLLTELKNLNMKKIPLFLLSTLIVVHFTFQSCKKDSDSSQVQTSKVISVKWNNDSEQHTKSYIYDSDKRLIKTISNDVTNYSYNSSCQISQIKTYYGSTNGIKSAYDVLYDNKGRISFLIDIDNHPGDTIAQFFYNSKDQVISDIRKDKLRNSTYTYDSNGNVTTMTYYNNFNSTIELETATYTYGTNKNPLHDSGIPALNHLIWNKNNMLTSSGDPLTTGHNSSLTYQYLVFNASGYPTSYFEDCTGYYHWSFKYTIEYENN